jgi:hypothetical protein
MKKISTEVCVMEGQWHLANLGVGDFGRSAHQSGHDDDVLAVSAHGAGGRATRSIKNN